jgi:copper transport protein
VRRRALRALLGLALVVGWLTTAAAPAFAHASLERSDPANGAVLATSPKRISLTFTEPPDLSLTTVGLIDKSGADVPTGPVERAGSDREIAVTVDDLPDGVYTVTWRTVSATDGHFTAGAFTFGVGVSPEEVVPVEGGAESESPSPTALAVLGRWALYVGLVVLFGAAIGGLLVWKPATAARPGLLATAWALAAVGVVLMTSEERRVVDVSLGTLLRSEAGGAYVRLGVAVGLAGLAAIAACLRPSRVTLAILAAAAGAGMLARAAGGHAGPGVAEIALQGVHFAAAGVWIGGLTVLVVAVRRGAEAGRVRAYSRVAGWALLVLLLTGILRASNELGLTWWLYPFRTDYSTALVAKLAIVVPLVALGALNRFRNTRRYEQLGSAPLLRTVGGELVLAAGVFAVTALLTGLPPQEPVAQTPPRSEPLVATGSDFATTTKVRLEVSPGTVGPNAFVAEITDFDTGEPVDARRVTLAFALPDRPEVSSRLRLAEGANGQWQAASTALALAGTWNVTVTVEEATGSVDVPLTVTTRPPQQHVAVSRAQGQPDIYTITLPGNVSIQSYVDPGVPGRTNQVHVTAFDADGAELPLQSVTLAIAQPDGTTIEPDLLNLSPGHVVANVEIQPGTSSFQITAVSQNGQNLSATFEQTFGG